jgi:hypothetical protein
MLCAFTDSYMVTIVPDGWHAPGAALVECTSIFLPPSFYGDVEKKLQIAATPYYAGRGRCLPRYGHNDVNQVKSCRHTRKP